ncbi:MAG: flagellar protein FlgN [Pseudomonadota bacterium]
MNQTGIDIADILKRLQEELAALDTFVALLKHEQQILVSSDAEPLLDLAPQKVQAAETLGARAAQRAQSIPAEPGRVESWLRQHAPAGLNTWNAIQRLGQEAQQLNRTNGSLIQVRMRYNQQALQALLGSSEQASGLYSAKGKADLPTSGRTLGSG